MHDRVRVAATAALLEQVDRDREGEVVDAPLLAAVLSSYQEVGMGLLDAYVDDFERALVAQAGLYYRAKALTWLGGMSTPEYLNRAEASWEAENRRVEAFLHVSTKPKLLHVVRCRGKGPEGGRGKKGGKCGASRGLGVGTATAPRLQDQTSRRASPAPSPAR